MMLLEAVSLGAPTIASDIPENTTLLPEWFPTFRVGDAADLARAASDYLALEPEVVADSRARRPTGSRSASTGT